MLDNVIEIYRNYGVLTREKRCIYTFRFPHDGAPCSEKIKVRIPDGWKLYETISSDYGITAPWGENYLINELLAGDEYPYFIAYDKSNVKHSVRLAVVV